jgi:hypothetical protein
MKQIIPKAIFHAGYGGATQYIGPNDGNGSLANGVGNPEYGRIPMPFDGTFRNLAVFSRDVFVGDFTINLFKNGSSTAQTVTLPVAVEGPVVSAAADVPVLELDDVSYQTVGPGPLVIPGHHCAVSLEFEGPGNVFGIAPVAGGKGVGLGWIGGAFGNGFFQSYDTGSPASVSTSYSICATDGTITRLALKVYNGAPGSGVFTAWFKVAGVLQDGTGGTVDTTTVLTGASTSILNSSFSLPVTLGQSVDVVVVRSGIDMPFAIASLAAGIGFVPDIEDAFMCCGGSNDAFDNTVDNYKWTRSDQTLPIDEHLVVGGGSGFRVGGIYVESGAPGSGKSWEQTLLRDEIDTEAVVTLSDLETSGVISGLSIYFGPTQTMTLRRTPTGAPSPSALYWGLVASVDDGSLPDGIIGPLLWIHFPRRTPGSP